MTLDWAMKDFERDNPEPQWIGDIETMLQHIRWLDQRYIYARAQEDKWHSG